ncbi:MAG: dockerin type I domain-containing protein, partial [Planctomycetota bacterium]|nr:dockerin type I domain-containing protein [Planctomycetota bacterium]
AVSSDSKYNGLNAADVSVTNQDNDTAGITLTPTTGLVTTESGGTATFTVVLNLQPKADVTIGLSSNNTAEGTVSPASLTFTPANWDAAQTVTITGVDDAVMDGNVAYTILTASTVSGDSSYNGLNAADVSVTNQDNDTTGVTVTPTNGLVTTEAGGTAAFTVKLTSQPMANVTLGLSSNNAAEGTVSPSSLTFTVANWNTAQTVTVTGVDDAIADGNVLYTIVTASAVSSDSNYNGLNAADVSVTNQDNDTAGVTVTPTSGLVTTEAGGTAAFTVKLTSQPMANVTLGLSSSNAAEGTVSPSSLIFTTANWNAAQTVTVTGVDDVVVDGNVAYTVVTAPAVSSDSNYNGLNAADVSVTNQDNDVAGITVTPTTGLTTTKVGGKATFTVALNTIPTASVTIALQLSNAAEATVSPTSLTFTSGNALLPQTVTVTGLDDGQTSDTALIIFTDPAVSTDAHYHGLDAADVSVTNLAVAHPFQNPTRSTDVNGDQQTTAIDVLLIINDINTNGTRALPKVRQPGALYLDINGDDAVTALDVLTAINYINNHPVSSAEGESSGVTFHTVSSGSQIVPASSWNTRNLYSPGSLAAATPSPLTMAVATTVPAVGERDSLARALHRASTAASVLKLSANVTQRQTFAPRIVPGLEEILDVIAADVQENYAG